jgi:hypothetical protein
MQDKTRATGTNRESGRQPGKVFVCFGTMRSLVQVQSPRPFYLSRYVTRLEVTPRTTYPCDSCGPVMEPSQPFGTDTREANFIGKETGPSDQAQEDVLGGCHGDLSTVSCGRRTKRCDSY